MNVKNMVPMIIAVVLGLLAVLLVGRQLRKEDQEEAVTEYYLVAAQNLQKGDTLSGENIKARQVARKDASRMAIAVPTPASAVKVYGQKLLRDVEMDDFILLTDLGTISISPLAEAVEPGKWAVTIAMDSVGGLAGLVRPGDEVAVVVTLAVPRKSKQSSLSGGGGAATERKAPATFVLYPKIKVLAIGKQVAGSMSPFSEDTQSGGEVTFLCTPAQAQELTHIRQFGRVSLAMRRAGDTAALEEAVFSDTTDATILDRLMARGEDKQ